MIDTSIMSGSIGGYINFNDNFENNNSIDEEFFFKWLRDSPNIKDREFNKLFTILANPIINRLIYDNNEIKIISNELFEELIKHPYLITNEMLNILCIKEYVHFFKMIYHDYNYDFTLVNYSINCTDNYPLFTALIQNNHEVVNLLLDKHPESVFHINEKYNIYHYLFREPNYDTFKRIFDMNPNDLTKSYKYNFSNPVSDGVVECYDYHPFIYLESIKITMNGEKINEEACKILKYCLNELNLDNENYYAVLYNDMPDDIRLLILEKIKDDKNKLNCMLRILIDINISTSILETMIRDYGLDVNEFFRDFRLGLGIPIDITILHYACYNGNFDTIKLLEKYGARFDLPYLTEYCKYQSNCELLKYLYINHNIDLNEMVWWNKYLSNQEFDNSLEKVPLIFSMLDHKSDDVNYLLDHDVNIYHMTSSGNTILHMATKKYICDRSEDTFDIIVRLLKMGIDPYHRNNKGKCFYHSKKFPVFLYDKLKLLYDMGIDLTMKNDDGNNMLDLLISNINDTVSSYHIVSDDNMSPYELLMNNEKIINIINYCYDISPDDIIKTSNFLISIGLN